MTPHAHDPATTRPDKGAVSNHQPSQTVWPVPYVRQFQKFYVYMLQVDTVSEWSLFRSHRSARKDDKSRQTMYFSNVLWLRRVEK